MDYIKRKHQVNITGAIPMALLGRAAMRYKWRAQAHIRETPNRTALNEDANLQEGAQVCTKNLALLQCG